MLQRTVSWNGAERSSRRGDGTFALRAKWNFKKSINVTDCLMTPFKCSHCSHQGNEFPSPVTFMKSLYFLGLALYQINSFDVHCFLYLMWDGNGHLLLTFPSHFWVDRTWLRCCLVTSLARENLNLPNGSFHRRSSDHPLYLSAFLNPQYAYSQRGWICTKCSGGGWVECWYAHMCTSLFELISFFILVS